MEERFICICCQRKKEKTAAFLREEYIGICRECNEKLQYIAKDAVFCGNENLQSIFSVFYYKGIIRNAISRYKFSGQRRYGKIFSLLMYDYLKDLELQKNFDLITMIPISKKRLWERGYNQSEDLAKALSEMLGIPFEKNCVFKKIDNKKQSLERNRLDRIANVENVYIADAKKVRGKSILLLDDIFTSGATMKSCAKELVEKGAECVSGIALAKVVR